MDNVSNKNILIVDDDPGQRSLLESFIRRQGFRVITAASGNEAWRLIQAEPPDMLISDVRMPGLSGLGLLEKVSENNPGLPVLLVTAHAEIRDAIGAIRIGAADYLEKPIDLDELLDTVCRALGLVDANTIEMEEGLSFPEGVVVASPAMHEVFREAALVAPSDTRLLITGESGTGKEVVADVIHRWSSRAGGPFVKVNCAAIPENLLESELFGHEKGAFTGALGRRIGRFEEAEHGTLLLDEIGEMPVSLQAKLLRVTQDGAFSRVGSNAVQHADVRILAATNRNLEKEVEEGRFREDLFYRLNVMEIYIPPLREHPSDIIPLAQNFAAQFGKGKPRFSPGAVAVMEKYHWPGNVRELRNAMERAVLLARGDIILVEHLPKKVGAMSAALPISEKIPAAMPGTVMDDVERTTILQALQHNGYNRTAAAQSLGISRRTLTYRLHTYREQGYTVDPE